jgi:hypothetical protein
MAERKNIKRNKTRPLSDERGKLVVSSDRWFPRGNLSEYEKYLLAKGLY